MGVAGVFLGLLVGWILGSQQAGPRPGAPPPAQAAAASAAAPTPSAPPLDERRVAALRDEALKNTSSPAPRVQLGNLYFDAEQYAEAARWYEEALKLDPKDPNVSTDLGIAYYYQNQPDRALQQFEQSLKIDPAHSKTLLNVGVVLAWGKQDLDGAARAWERVIAVAPDSEEAKRAKQGLEGIRAAHPEAGKGKGTS